MNKQHQPTTDISGPCSAPLWPSARSNNTVRMIWQTVPYPWHFCEQAACLSRPRPEAGGSSVD